MGAAHGPSQTFWARSWRKLRRNPSGMSGLIIVAVLLFTAMAAPLLANDRPIVASYQGETVFPAVTTYTDSWVPWTTARNDLKSWEMTQGYFPFSDHYASLDGQSWKDVEDQLDWGVWPIVRWSPRQFDPTAILLKPGERPEHLLGTDDAGRDVLSRLIHGTVVAMLVGLVAMGIACTIGISLGLTAGFFGGWVDLILSRVTEVVMCFPTFFLIIAVIAFLEPSIVNIMMVIGLVGWTGIFRLIRGEVLQTRSQDFVLSAKALGLPSWRTMFVHVLPNSISPVFVAVAFGIARAVLTETSLSFLGFGDPSVPSWGEIVKQGRFYVSQGMWHLTIFPGLAIFVTLTAYNLFGQGLRDVLDPKLRD
jgi:peptide/nickel transport system permease protein